MLHCATVAYSESSGAEFGRPWFNMRRNVFGVSETTNWSGERVTVLLARVEDLVPGWRRRTDTRTCLCNMKRMTTKTWRPRTTQLEIRIRSPASTLRWVACWSSESFQVHCMCVVAFRRVSTEATWNSVALLSAFESIWACLADKPLKILLADLI